MASESSKLPEATTFRLSALKYWSKMASANQSGSGTLGEKQVIGVLTFSGIVLRAFDKVLLDRMCSEGGTSLSELSWIKLEASFQNQLTEFRKKIEDSKYVVSYGKTGWFNPEDILKWQEKRVVNIEVRSQTLQVKFKTADIKYQL